jgi:hypothetical protein
MINGGWSPDPPSNVVEAGHLFARREFAHKYRWEPSASVLRQVSDLTFGPEKSP